MKRLFILVLLMTIPVFAGLDAKGGKVINVATATDSTDAANKQYVDDTAVGERYWINVKDYGAVGDGTTDDATAIQATFDALGNGDTIYFPNTGSDYIVKSALTCNADNIRIIGGTKELGSRLNFQNMGGADGLTLGGYGLYIENLTLWSPDSSTDDGLVLWRNDIGVNSLDHTLIHCEFSGHGGDGLLMAAPITTVLIGCKSVGNGGNGFSFDGSLHGGIGGTSITVIGCWSDANTGWGCLIKGITGFNWSGGANVGNTKRAFQFVSSTACSVIGVDGEGATAGFASTDGESRGIRFDSIFIRGVGAGSVGFNINNSKAVTIDNIVFQTIAGDHFNLTNVVDCHIGKITDLDDGDASAITFLTRTGSCTRSPGQLLSFSSGDTTPSVCAGPNFDIPNSVTITDFDDGTAGQVVTIIAENSITITDGTNIFLNGSINFDMLATDTLTLICKADNTWEELSRKVDSGKVIIGSDPPATAASTGTAGTITYDSDYFYVAVATDTWKRTALTTWAVVVENVIFAGENVIFAAEQVVYP